MNIYCPLCGRGLAESSFHPEQQLDVVEAVNVRGLGRGKGFAFSERYSILEPEHPVIDRIRNRISVLVELLDVSTADAEEANRLLRIIKAKDQLIEELSDKTVTMTHSSGQMKQQLKVKDKMLHDFSEEMMTLQARIEELENEAEEDQQLIEDLTAELASNEDEE